MSKRPALDPMTLAQFTGSVNFHLQGLVREVLYTQTASGEVVQFSFARFEIAQTLYSGLVAGLSALKLRT